MAGGGGGAAMTVGVVGFADLEMPAPLWSPLSGYGPGSIRWRG